MSRWPKRSKVEAAAIVSWVFAVIATVLRSDSTTAFAAVIYAGYGTAFAYQLMTRRWWTAAGLALLGGPSALNFVNHGSASHFEHDLTLGLELVGAAIAIVAGPLGKRARTREGQRIR